MERWQNRVAVVTGSSSGIGLAITKDLLKAGLRVVGLARRLDRLKEIKETLQDNQCEHFYPIKCDVSDLASVNNAFDWICENLGGVDLLVNNAGMVNQGVLCQMESSLIQQTLQVNVMGVVYCTQRAFKSMKERNFDGHVVLINSIFGHKVVGGLPGKLPEFNILSPTKYSITAMTEIYRQEFNGLGTKIKITSISPGGVNTEALQDHTKELLKDCILKPEDVSAAVLYAVGTPPHVQVHELIIKPVGELF